MQRTTTKVMIIILLATTTTTMIRNADAQTGETGFFWHITDLHYDPSYNSSGPLGVSCGQPHGGFSAPSGAYGSYLCDSPWTLIRSSIQAMKDIRSDVDFVIWTGDDTPHNADSLSKDGVADIIRNITDEILLAFNDTKVFPVLGNHDWSPKSQIPPKDDPFYATIASIWEPWLTTKEANDTFSRSGFYCIPLNEKVLLVGLNTNLLYDSNAITASMPDPGNQLQWLDDTLTKANKTGLKVILISHVPPGQFEKHRSKHWFRPHYNQLFVELLRKHSRVLGSIHFGHHHTDSFRLFYDDKGKTTGSFFIAPSVTPWETTLPEVMGGAGNNPGVRLVEYQRSEGSVVNVRQYYLNLTNANAAQGGPGGGGGGGGQTAAWLLAYDARDYFGLTDLTPSSLKTLVDGMWTDDGLFGKYYAINGLFYDPNEQWTPEYRIVHCCAIEELDYANYTACVDRHSPSAPSSAAPAGGIHRPTTTTNALLLSRQYAASAAAAAAAMVLGREATGRWAFGGI